MSFEDLGLSAEVLRAVSEAGYTEPTPIQAQAIPHVLNGKDVLGVAQTGTGKTASFTLPMIDRLSKAPAKARMPRALVIEPTRELAHQVARNFETYSKYTKFSMVVLVGGESMGDQITKLQRGVDVLIATPGRLLDLFDRGNILLRGVSVLVLDECDRMLDMGFIPDIERIVPLVSPRRQSLLFSATLPREIRRLAEQFLHEPVEITVAPETTSADTVAQHLVVTEAKQKRGALREILARESVGNAFIFCNRKRDIGVLCRSLQRHGHKAEALHGDMPQHKRTETLEKFKQGDITLLVCSDVAARGLDITGMSHVFNFDVPLNADDYVHRIGRTGRAGKTGRAFTIATPNDTKYVAAIESYLGKPIPRFALEGVPIHDLVADEEESEGGRSRGRGRKGDAERPRSGAGKPDKAPASKSGQSRRGSDKPRHDHDDRIEVEAEATAETDAPATEDAPAPVANGQDSTGQNKRDSRSESSRPSDTRSGGKGRQSQRRRQRDQDDDSDTQVVGFGDDIPAFMNIPGKSR